MSKSIIFRAFEESDYPALEQVIRETWCYDRFCTPQTAAQLASVYLTVCLANQTFTQVALVDNVPVGIIMGKNRATHKSSFSLQLKKIKSIVKLMISKEGRSVSKIFGCVDGLIRNCYPLPHRLSRGTCVFCNQPEMPGKRNW